jgi:hypothetical protein
MLFLTHIKKKVYFYFQSILFHRPLRLIINFILQVSKTWPDADVGLVELVDDAPIDRLFSGSDALMKNRTFFRTKPVFDRFRTLPQVDGQHQQQVVGQNLGSHPNVVIKT